MAFHSKSSMEFFLFLAQADEDLNLHPHWTEKKLKEIVSTVRFVELCLMLLIYVKLCLSISIYKFGTLNLSMEISLFLWKIQKKLPFCVTSSKLSILFARAHFDIAKDFMFNTSRRLWIYVTFFSKESRWCSILASRADMFSSIAINDSSNFSNICAC